MELDDLKCGEIKIFSSAILLDNNCSYLLLTFIVHTFYGIVRSTDASNHNLGSVFPQIIVGKIRVPPNCICFYSGFFTRFPNLQKYIITPLSISFHDQEDVFEQQLAGARIQPVDSVSLAWAEHTAQTWTIYWQNNELVYQNTCVLVHVCIIPYEVLNKEVLSLLGIQVFDP